MSRLRHGWFISGMFLATAWCSGEELSIRLERVSGSVTTSRFVLSGVPSDRIAELRSVDADDKGWQKLFAVYVLTNGKPVSTAMLGTYTIAGDTVVFEPKYPLRAGVEYRAMAAPGGRVASGGGPSVTKDFRAGELPRPSAKLTQIFPSGDVVPENLLKFYLHFSAPMSRGEAYQRIHLLDKNGKQVEAPFLELGEELWSPDGHRFTLYFDPGRIKRGLQPRELFGPALLEGGSYTLVVDREWLDANGLPMESTLTKKFRVVAPDDVQPNPRKWKVQSPEAGTRKPLVVVLDEPLDHAMLQRVLSVQDAAGNMLPGTIRIESHETRWLFEPKQAWAAGQYRLVTLQVLEDRCGNSIRRPFEVDILRPATDASDSETAEIRFMVE